MYCIVGDFVREGLCPRDYVLDSGEVWAPTGFFEAGKHSSLPSSVHDILLYSTLPYRNLLHLCGFIVLINKTSNDKRTAIYCTVFFSKSKSRGEVEGQAYSLAPACGLCMRRCRAGRLRGFRLALPLPRRRCDNRRTQTHLGHPTYTSV